MLETSAYLLGFLIQTYKNSEGPPTVKESRDYSFLGTVVIILVFADLLIVENNYDRRNLCVFRSRIV